MRLYIGMIILGILVLSLVQQAANPLFFLTVLQHMKKIPYTHRHSENLPCKKGIQIELFADWWRLLMITHL